jgi:fumarate reductase subunit C
MNAHAAADARLQVRLWLLQRTSAALLAPLMLVHLVIIVYAVHQGLSSQAILARLHHSLVFGIFYTLFVLACAAHVPVGVARVAEEWLSWSERASLALGALFSLLLLAGGMRAVWGLVWA